MKRLKYLFMVLVMVTCMLGSSGTVSASNYSTGKAIIPMFVQESTEKSGFYISNITDNPISVTVTLYNSDGTIVSDDNNPNTGRIVASSELQNYSESGIGSTITFTINAHCSGSFHTAMFPTRYSGYGVIKWEQSGSALQGLIVQGTFYSLRPNGEESRFSIPINGGLPF